MLGELRVRVYDDLKTSGFFPDMLEEEVRHVALCRVCAVFIATLHAHVGPNRFPTNRVLMYVHACTRVSTGEA